MAPRERRTSEYVVEYLKESGADPSLIEAVGRDLELAESVYSMGNAVWRGFLYGIVSIFVGFFVAWGLLSVDGIQPPEPRHVLFKFAWTVGSCSAFVFHLLTSLLNRYKIQERH